MSGDEVTWDWSLLDPETADLHAKAVGGHPLGPGEAHALAAGLIKAAWAAAHTRAYVLGANAGAMAIANLRGGLAESTDYTLAGGQATIKDVVRDERGNIVRVIERPYLRTPPANGM